MPDVAGIMNLSGDINQGITIQGGFAVMVGTLIHHGNRDSGIAEPLFHALFVFEGFGGYAGNGRKGQNDQRQKDGEFSHIK
jgi:hypothetical protein